MMNTYNETHNVVITSSVVAIKDNPTEGQITPRNVIVESLEFYEPNFNELGMEIYQRVNLSKKFIIDLADQIKYLESKIIDKPYEKPLPF